MHTLEESTTAIFYKRFFCSSQSDLLAQTLIIFSHFEVILKLDFALIVQEKWRILMNKTSKKKWLEKYPN